MARVDFYILADNSRRTINQMVCRLCEKALTNTMQVLIYTQTHQQAQVLDEQLWTFKSTSFIPHCILSDDFLPDLKEKNENFHYPVVIKALDTSTEQNMPEHYTGLLINLSQTIPAFIQKFERIAEMVDKNEAEKQQARGRYRQYRQMGYTLNKHDL